jgi:hypothetical protein
VLARRHAGVLFPACRRRASGLARALAIACLLFTACDGGGAGQDAGHRDGGSTLDAGALLSDPLSMPERPTLEPSAFMGAQACERCHPVHYEQWRKSMHAYAMVDPVFRALVVVRQQDFDGAQDRFCLQCHSAIATRGGEIVPGFDFDELGDIAGEGVTCEACHKVSAVERPFNSGHVIDPEGPMRGPLRDPEESGVHASAHGEHFDTAEFCAGCHDVVEVSGLNLERPYQEWTESPSAAAGESCQSCHMPDYDGRAATDGPERDGLHAHTFVGVDVPLVEGFVSADERDALREQARSLLEGKVSVHLQAPATVRKGEQLDLVVRVRNLIEGHSFPTGSTSLRQAWLEVTARDASGAVLYRTGDLDENGDLRDHFSELDPYGDADLVTYHSRLVDPLGMPEIFPWRAAEHFTSSIPPLYERTHTLFVPTADAAEGPITIEARVRFRTHPPYLLRALGLERLIDALETYDVGDDEIAVDLTP